ncbi:hypothetical protein [uncultured Desulfovibrio sp.]|uniref:hypothetical protein n=1 Tax=uncultured Desulfovibrio sp. TaxID=167968 RepID=UPI00262CFE2B|nr:hypothetical protein [uncultured Desulfovibrio sp.]
MDIPTLTPEEIAGSLQTALERMLAPVVDSIGQIERLKRREYLTAEEVELVYGLKAVTLANKRMKAQGPEYIKDGDKILYKQQAVKTYLETKTIRTSSSPAVEANIPRNRFKK